MDDRLERVESSISRTNVAGAETQVDRLGDIQDLPGTCDRLAMGAESGGRDRDTHELSGCRLLSCVGQSFHPMGEQGSLLLCDCIRLFCVSEIIAITV